MERVGDTENVHSVCYFLCINVFEIYRQPHSSVPNFLAQIYGQIEIPHIENADTLTFSFAIPLFPVCAIECERSTSASY